jgi:1,2-phenylacetyl-CoA epoxidase catalytic subunit
MYRVELQLQLVLSRKAQCNAVYRYLFAALHVTRFLPIRSSATHFFSAFLDRSQKGEHFHILFISKVLVLKGK